MIERSVDNRIYVIEQKIQSLNQNPPEWFTREINNLNAKIDRTSIELKEQTVELKKEMAGLKEEMVSGFEKSEYRYACLNNMFRKAGGFKAGPVPFLNTHADLEKLPSITSVEDIDSLSKHECQTYLKAYNVEFRSNETVKLKERLRDAVGLVSIYDASYQFGGFQS